MRATISLRKMFIALTTLLVASPLDVSLLAVPAAPSNLTAQVTGTTVTLTWTAPSGPLVGYRLEAGTASGLSNVAIAVLDATPALTVSSVPDGRYFVRVYAIATDGASGPSNEIIVLVSSSGCTVRPNPPLALTAVTSGAQVTLTWSAGAGCRASNFVLSVGALQALAISLSPTWVPF